MTPKESAACDLCGLPVIGRPIRDRERDFCCEGCRRVYATAEDAGIAELLAPPEARSTRSRVREGAGAGARKAAAAAAAGARRETLRIDGMWCASCGLVLEDALMALPGVLDAEASYSASLLRVTWDPAVSSLDGLLERIKLLGYGATPAREVAHARADTEELFLRAFVSAVVGMWVMWPTYFVLWPAFARGEFASVRAYEAFTGALALVVLAYGGWPFLAGAWRAVRVRRATMDTLVVLGTWTAWCYSAWASVTSSGPTYFESAAMIVTIVLVGRWLEAVGTRDATTSLARLAESAEECAWLAPADDGEARRVPLSEIETGATVLVRAGERVPVDGVVLAGESELDRSRLTGEPLPATVRADDEVWAGTVNLTGLLTVRVERLGSMTLAGRLAALAEDAAFAKSHAQRVADAIAAVFVPVVIAIAGATVLIGLATGVPLASAVGRAVAVLVVSCPCALALATPLAVANAVGAGARHGILLRGGPALERAQHITTVAFDKTGTLTAGVLSLSGALPADMSEPDTARVIALAAALEGGDPHPVATAILEAASRFLAPELDGAFDVPTSATAVKRHPGAGISGDIGDLRVLAGSERLLAEEGVPIPDPLAHAADAARTQGELVIWITADGELLGGLRFADTIRPEAAEAIAALHAAGVRTAVVSGDALATCGAVAGALGIDEVHAEVLPHEKDRVVRDLAEERGGALAFVGDGINDAAALGAADIAVAMAGGADVAVLSADVVLTRDGSPLSAMPALMTLASATRRVIAQNLAWAFTYNAVAIPLAVAGRLSPVVAAAAMAASSLAVVANSWRLRLAVRETQGT